MTISCALALPGHAALAAPAPPCTVPAPAAPIARLAQLPAAVQSALQESGPVSDPGGPFNPGDVIVDPDHPVPGMRLLSGQAGADVICLQVEQGGRGYHHAAIRFERAGGQWTLVSKVNRMPDRAR